MDTLIERVENTSWCGKCRSGNEVSTKVSAHVRNWSQLGAHLPRELETAVKKQRLQIIHIIGKVKEEPLY